MNPLFPVAKWRLGRGGIRRTILRRCGEDVTSRWRNEEGSAAVAHSSRRELL